MIRVIVFLFWVGLLVGTLVAHRIVTNWAVTLAGLYFIARWWARRGQRVRPGHATVQADVVTSASNATTPAAIGVAPAAAQSRSRWTVDRVHVSDRRWR